MAAAAPLIADPIVRNRGTLVGSLCHADPQGDWASVVLSLGGSIVAQGPRGRRSIPVADFVTGPFENVLEPDEIAIEAVIPPARGERSGGYLKLERRVGDFATVGVAVSVEISGADGDAGPASGSPASAARRSPPPRPRPHSPAGRSRPSRSRQAAELAAGAARPRTDHRGSAEYKRHMVATFVERILTGSGNAHAGDSAERAA